MTLRVSARRDTSFPLPDNAAGRRGLRRLAQWLRTPIGGLTGLILGTLALRLAFAASLGLGIDESYMVAAGRHWQLSYFDHPPIAWWLAWAAARISGSEAAVIVRLPYIALFVLSTLLMYRLTTVRFGERAGLAAAAVLNAAPVLGVTTATWVLPDGPLVAALLGAVACLIHALPAQGRQAWGWWLATGTCAGFALLSKYSAALTIVGALLYLATAPRVRHWLAKPQPYCAALVAVILFLPVVFWNAQHGWVSLLFQGGRASGHFFPFGSFSALGGAALYFLPWIWGPLVWCGIGALRRGPADDDRWLFLCLALPPILLFTIIALWSRILFHWATPGYLMLVPLLGEMLARHWRSSDQLRRAAIATGTFVALGVLIVAVTVRLDWLAAATSNSRLAQTAAMAAHDWGRLRNDLEQRGLIARPDLVVAATRWYDAGKIDYALGGRVPVICLGSDPRQYGIAAPISRYWGWDVLIIAPRTTGAQIVSRFGGMFRSFEVLSPVRLLGNAASAPSVSLFLGRGLREPVVSHVIAVDRSIRPQP